MKKRFIPLLALLLSLCILVPVSIAQSAAEGAVQISVIATGGSVEIADHAVAGGSSYNVEENATVSIKAVPQDGYVFDSWSVTSGGTIAEDELKKNPATLSVTTEAVTCQLRSAGAGPPPSGLRGAVFAQMRTASAAQPAAGCAWPPLPRRAAPRFL